MAPPPRLIVIGASAGGVAVLRRLAAGLPPDLPAAVLVVLHIGGFPSQLPLLLQHVGRLPVTHAAHHDLIVPGHIYVAPPDRHMLVDGDRIALSRDAKENHSRPAVDPLFRSAAMARGSDVIGVVLTGGLDDGTAGLQAIKQCGGIAVVQDPDDALERSMPLSALRHVAVDHVVTADGLAALLARLAAMHTMHTMPQAPAIPPALQHEADLMAGRGDPLQHLQQLGKPSTYTCPDCHGSLWEIDGVQPRRFRCHTGHAYSARSLAQTMSATVDAALWNALRAVQEHQLLLQDIAAAHVAGEDEARLSAVADRLAKDATQLHDMLDGEPRMPKAD